MSRLNILHIGYADGSQTSGVSVAIPQIVKSQSDIANVLFLNLFDLKVSDNTVLYSQYKSIQELSAPFSHPDLVVFHEIYRPPFLKLYQECLRSRIPYIIIPHGGLTANAQQKKRYKKIPANILLFNRYIDHAAAVQCLSAQELAETTRGSNRFIATNGTDIPNKMKREFSRDSVKFIYIGRLDAFHKGLDLMVEAFRLKADLLRASGCTLDIYGPDVSGSSTRLSRLIAKADVGDIVRLHGPVFSEEKERLLLGSDIFIQTSRLEGMPLGILEALSYGIPCLVTDGASLGSLVESANSGWRAETNSESIAAALEQAVNERGCWAEKGKNGRSFMEEHFAWEKIARDTVGYYSEVARS